MPSEQSDTPFCTSEAGLSYSQTCTCAPGCKLATAVALFDPIGTSCSRSTRNFCLCPSRLTSTCSLSMTSCTTPLSRGCNRGSRILRNPSAAPGTGARAAMMRTMGQRLRLRHILAVLSITEYRNRSYSKSPHNIRLTLRVDINLPKSGISHTQFRASSKFITKDFLLPPIITPRWYIIFRYHKIQGPEFGPGTRPKKV